MKTTTTILQMLIRSTGLILIILGVLFWTGNALNLISIHMLLGLLLVLALWMLAGLAAWAGVSARWVVLAIIWGLVVPILGMTQGRLLPGSAHWIIKLVHLLVGIGAMGQAEGLVSRIRSRQAPTPALQPDQGSAQ